MRREARKYLVDIQLSIGDIELFTAGIKSFEEFLNDRKTYSAVERHLIIIGEAIHKFRILEADVKIDDAGKIYGLRNRLVHAYDSIDANTLYSIVRNHLPKLKREVEGLLSQEGTV